MANAKLIVTLDGEVIRELELMRDRITIGRRPYNDIVLDTPSISGEHAMIATVLNESILEDLNSTNGTYVNGQPIKKHFLQNGDVIELVKYRIEYLDAAHAGSRTAPSRSVDKSGNLLVLSGSNAGTSLPLTKEVTTLGRPGTQLAAIIKRSNGFAVSHVEGPAPLVNQEPVGATPHPLADGDIIDLSGTQVQFSLR
ncbi:MAG: FHA domain-containing protein [Oxalobacter sp.]|nr:MAG: FHA domain-containing protein [Oxalobacter sp.]